MDNDPSAKTTPEKLTLDDNARKFVCEPFDPHDMSKEVTAFTLTTDWLETDEDSERKLAYKKFDSGEVQILLIEKVTKDGKRKSVKQEITLGEYEKLLKSSILRVEKKRSEFMYEQNGVIFSAKFDDFGNENSAVLEIDAATDDERMLFDPSKFPFSVTEVTGDLSYYGYRIAGHLS